MTSTLATALVAFQSEMPTVTKGKKASVPTKTGGSYSYTYADLADVTAAGIPVLGKHGLSFTSRPRRCDGGDYELEGVLMHTSGETSTGSLPLHGRTPQELGSALTYARRYLFGCLTGIVTDDDDDAQAANHAKRSNPRQEAEERKKAEWTAAGQRARAAWQANHSGEAFDFTAMDEHFQSGHNGMRLGQADTQTLIAYAEALEAR